MSSQDVRLLIAAENPTYRHFATRSTTSSGFTVRDMHISADTLNIFIQDMREFNPHAILLSLVNRNDAEVVNYADQLVRIGHQLLQQNRVIVMTAPLKNEGLIPAELGFVEYPDKINDKSFVTTTAQLVTLWNQRYSGDFARIGGRRLNSGQ